MKLVLKVKNGKYFFSDKTKTSLTKSPLKATNVDIKLVVKNLPQILELFDFYVIEKPGDNPKKLIDMEFYETVEKYKRSQNNESS